MTVYETEVRQNVSIMGNGTSNGGILGKLRVNGDGRIYGDADCLIFRCNGSAEVEGSLRSRETRVNGQLNVNDNLEAEQMKINGGLKAGGSARIGHIHVNGDLLIGNTLSSVKLTVNGTLEARDEIGVENLTVRGKIKAGRALYGREINIKLHGGSSQVSRMTGESISVSISRLARVIGSLHITSLKTGHIEGDDIFLENTIADTVRGRRVTIGRGCVIGLVEYSEELRTDRSAEILNAERI
ncbi:hypothetical protein SAMN05661091_0388 [Paenibacillus uliginis N3/975]|uniref:Protein CcmA, bactofilin family n=1 Tax=Paenibacillus uliginis N3/975 TaxID=1313296 RepID=A0A1X7GER9_9BACL|nr:hypothetical protein [Paenibacillus uliginis]SMF67910.1 hypothetical protein SAMN05661091_0388 [Paenibacillus uliginis N3/975]